MPEAGKKLSELKVSDLKDELEKRKLDTVGAKATLLERLQNALKSQGIDPNAHVFTSNSKGNSTVDKKIVHSPMKTSVEVTLVKQEPIEDESTAVENNEDDEYREQGHDGRYIDEVGTVDDECVIIEDDDYEEENGEDLLEEERDEDGDEENAVDSNNQDNEESINLTIGEEEQKLLHDEAPDDKDKSMADEQTKAVRKDAELKTAEKENKSDNQKNNTAGKEEKKGAKEDDGSKIRKNEDKSNDKKDDSEQKSSSKTSHKEDKEKTTTTSSNIAATNAASDSAKATVNSKSSALSRNLWVSGLSSLTRASDLKTIFSKYGKVIGAKVVTNTRTPGTRCYGYVTMSSSSDAGSCIEHLHRTELHGRIISVERTKNEIGGSASSAVNTSSGVAKNSSAGAKKRDTSGKDSKPSNDDKKKSEDKRNSTRGSSSKKDDSKRDDKSRPKADDKEKDKNVTKEGEKDKDDKARSETSSAKRPSRRSTDRLRNDRTRDYDREREQRQKERERERDRVRQREILSYQKIREERERQRLREKERELREEERRRREIRDRQRQEEQRLAEERKKLALERERLEREKAELLRLERERQKLEREKIELERLELKRQQMKIIHAREDPLKRPVKRSADDRYSEATDRKRPSGNDTRFEAPPPPRFDAALVQSRSYDKKREDYSTSASSKRAIEDYSSSKRADYTSTGTKRAAISDYAPIPSKRSADDYSKRSATDYISSSSGKRNADDYSSSNKRDDYSSSKRDVELRHISASGSGGGTTSYHKGSGSRYVEPEIQVRSSVGSFRRMDDRSDVRSAVSKRYDNSSGYGASSDRNVSSNSVWAPSSSSHLGHSSSSGVPTMKSYVSNGISSGIHSGSSVWQKSGTVEEPNWRSIQSSQDRYDRTYNERSGNYLESSRTSGGIYGGSGRPAPDRYGGAVSSRYENSKY